MLILTRKLGEIIRIGDDVTVRVIEVRGNQIRLGLEAPPKVRIYREEIYREIQSEARQAGAAANVVHEALETWRDAGGKDGGRDGGEG